MRWLAFAASILLMLPFAILTFETSFIGDQPRTGSRISPGDGPLPRGGGRSVVGQPYEVDGHWYSPAEQPHYDETGIASWYGPGFHRRETANGEWFDMDYLTAAHTTLPLPSYVRVTNLENGRALVVRVNDRGPFVGDRIIDLSRKSAEALKMRGRGTARVRVQYLGPAPLNDTGVHLAAMNRKQDDEPAHELAAAEASIEAKRSRLISDVSRVIDPVAASSLGVAKAGLGN